MEMDLPSCSSGVNLNINNYCKCIIEQLLVKSFGSYTFVEKQNIINIGRPTPKLLDLKTKCKKNVRYFNFSYYDSNKWLSGCQYTQKLYCWPCLLFSHESNIWSKYGCNDLNNFHNLKHRHEISRSHIESLITLKKFGNVRIETCLSEAFKKNIEKHNETVKNNRYVLRRFIDATCYLAKQELSFRGHDEQLTSVNRGNYVELINLMGTLDPKLNGHLETSTVFSGLSGDIQNDLIQSISNTLLKIIKIEIKNTDFVSIIMDETTDIVSKSQLTTILRYMTYEGVQERFLGCIDVSSDRSATSLFSHLYPYK